MIQSLRLLLIALVGAGALAFAQDQSASPPADTTEDAAEREDADEDVFIPTEEIPADEEVTFPVDI